MPIESLKVTRAPKDWQPDRDQQARIQSDPRLQRMGRDDLYYAMMNRPKGQGSPTNREAMNAAATNAMSWHPSAIFNHVADLLRGARGE